MFCDEIYTKIHLKRHLNMIWKVHYRIFLGYTKISIIFGVCIKYPISFGGTPSDQIFFGGTEQMLGPSLCIPKNSEYPPPPGHMGFLGFSTRSHTNRSVQPQKMARGF